MTVKYTILQRQKNLQVIAMGVGLVTSTICLNHCTLSGEGGPMSKYAESCTSGGWSSGAGIIPMTRQEAMYWCESTENYDILESEFADLIEDA